MRRPFIFTLPLAAALALTACIPDRAAWDPKGERLYVNNVLDGGLDSVDPAGGPSRRIFHAPGEPVVFCFAAGSSRAVFFATDRPGSPPEDPVRDLHLIRPDGSILRKLAESVNVEAGMSASASGDTAYYIRAIREGRGGKDGQTWELWKARPLDPQPAPVKLFSSREGFGYPCASADGSRVLLTFESSIRVYGAATGKVELAIPATKELPALYGVWALGETAAAYIECVPASHDPLKACSLGRLAIRPLAGGEVRRLAGGVPILRRPMPVPGGNEVLVSRSASAAEGTDMDRLSMREFQIEAIDLKTGETRRLTEEREGALWPYPAPAGEKFAYFAVKAGTRGDRAEEQILKFGSAAPAAK